MLLQQKQRRARRAFPIWQSRQKETLAIVIPVPIPVQPLEILVDKVFRMGWESSKKLAVITVPILQVEILVALAVVIRLRTFCLAKICKWLRLLII